MGAPGEFELLTLLAISRLGSDAYGVSVRDVLEERISRSVALGTVYKSLGRLEEKGLISAEIVPPTGERGGRRKKVYRVTPQGLVSVRGALSDLRRMTDGLEPELELP